MHSYHQNEVFVSLIFLDNSEINVHQMHLCFDLLMLNIVSCTYDFCFDFVNFYYYSSVLKYYFCFCSILYDL